MIDPAEEWAADMFETLHPEIVAWNAALSLLARARQCIRDLGYLAIVAGVLPDPFEYDGLGAEIDEFLKHLEVKDD